MSDRWSPTKAVVVSVIATVVLVLGGSFVMVGIAQPRDPHAVGEAVGRALVPILVVVGIIAYAVQNARLRSRK